MIHVKVVKKEGLISNITLKGHANFAPFGKDIVCAGVSSILTTTINAILKLKKEAIIYQQEKDSFRISVKDHDHTTEVLLENMIDLLKQLEQDYQKNIKVEEEEQ